MIAYNIEKKERSIDIKHDEDDDMVGKTNAPRQAVTMIDNNNKIPWAVIKKRQKNDNNVRKRDGSNKKRQHLRHQQRGGKELKISRLCFI